jgi:hypothetical protein
MIRLFGKGTSPKDWPADLAVPSYDELIELLHDLSARLRSDYDEDRFQSFRRYETMAGPVLESVEDAIRFTLFHEGMHLGYVLSLRRALGVGI